MVIFDIKLIFSEAVLHVNRFSVVFCRGIERSTPIFFENITTKEVSSDFFESRRVNVANNHYIPSVIQMNAGLTERNLECRVDLLSKRLKGLPSHLPSIYSVYRYLAFEVMLTMQVPLS